MTSVDDSHVLRWYVLQTKPKQEQRAAANLQAWGLETLAPRLREQLRPQHIHAASHRVAPLFPGYIFARFDADVLFAKVRYTRGIRNVVGFGEYATPVEDTIISLIQSRTRDDGFVHVAGPQPGEVVEVIDGPMQSLTGIFERQLSQDDRVLILLTTIRSQVRVEVPKACIRSMTTRVMV